MKDNFEDNTYTELEPLISIAKYLGCNEEEFSREVLNLLTQQKKKIIEMIEEWKSDQNNYETDVWNKIIDNITDKIKNI